MAPSTLNGIESIRSQHTVDATVERLRSLLEARGVKVFAIIDHSGEAARVGLTMPRTRVVIFGNPRAGTPVMLAAPTAALDLPLKILVAEDAKGTVWLSYDSAAWLQDRHQIPEALVPNLAVVARLAASATE